MSEQNPDDALFDYKVYRFGRSRQLFRGPQPNLRGSYLSFIGASHTFGRYADRPFASVLEEKLGTTALNLGTEGAGPGFFLGDPEVLRVASDAEVCVVEAMSAMALSNRMFTVRPRRNIRLHAVSDLLRGIFPDVEFERFSFVRPMLAALREQDETRYRLVLNEMRNAWIGRMQSLINAIETKTILLWFAQRAPEDVSDHPDDPDMQSYPEFVDRAMLESVAQVADGYVEVTSQAGMPQDLTVDGRPVLFRPSGEPINANRQYPSPEMHTQAAEMLIPEIARLRARR